MHKSRAVALRPIMVCMSYNLSRISVVNNSGNALRRQGTCENKYTNLSIIYLKLIVDWKVWKKIFFQEN